MLSSPSNGRSSLQDKCFGAFSDESVHFWWKDEVEDPRSSLQHVRWLSTTGIAIIDWYSTNCGINCECDCGILLLCVALHIIIYVSISPNTAILSILWGKAPACCRTCAIEWWDVCHFGCNAHNSQTWIWIILKLAWLLLYSLVTLFSLLLWPDRM